MNNNIIHKYRKNKILFLLLNIVAFLTLLIIYSIRGHVIHALLSFAFFATVALIQTSEAFKLNKNDNTVSLLIIVSGVILLPGLYTTIGFNSAIIGYLLINVKITDLYTKALKKDLLIGGVVLVFATLLVLDGGFGLLSIDSPKFLDLVIEHILVILIASYLLVFSRLSINKRLETLRHTQSEELLSLINESATLLISTDPDQFDTSVAECMSNIARCLNIDCIFIWKLGQQNGMEGYDLLYDWYSEKSDSTKSIKKQLVHNFIPRTPDWDERLFGERGYLSEITRSFGTLVGQRLYASGVKAIMGFPVFFQGEYWGFVSYENRHDETLCSEKEASILASGSLLLANAIERNGFLTILNERLVQQQLMSDISKSFISKEPLGVLINQALSQTGTFLNVERVLIAVFEKDSDLSHPEYVWFKDSKYTPNISQKGFSSILRSLFPKKHDDSDEYHTIFVDNTETYCDGKFKIFHEKGGVISFIGIPIYVNSDLWGIMSIEKLEGLHNWNDNDAQLVSMVSSAIANAVARDVVEKERAVALASAIAASSAKSDFLSNMSHEIRTPMNAIIGMTAIGKSSHTLDKKDYAFEKIDNASKHLLGVINDILDMSKIEANKLELSPTNFEFERMVQQVVNVINFRVDERKQHLYINIDDNIPTMLVGDDQRLAQVITNLLSNAIKFTPEEGYIYLNAFLGEMNNDSVILKVEVADNGIGITQEQKERLFRSFEQADRKTSRMYGGTGLGLAISKRIIELMEGNIWVESSPGQGSKFAFTIKLQKSRLGKKPHLSDQIDWKNLQILAIDDEPQVRDFFLETSHSMGVPCQVAGSAEEAIELLSRDNKFGIFFIDWKLPGQSGIDLARHIREKMGTDFVIILFSACDWSLIEEDARAVGIDKFLPKPLFRSTVIDLINDYVDPNQVTQAEKIIVDDFEQFTILLAEDVDINREIVATLLEDTKIHIDFAENGVEAVELYVKDPSKYDLIFMDIQMPKMDGYEATQLIRKTSHKNSHTIPIVAMTANVFKEDIEKCLGAGMNDHVGKPINLDEIILILRKYLKKGDKNESLANQR